MAIPTPAPTTPPFSLAVTEQALVAGVGAGAAAALAGEFGPLSMPIKGGAVVALGVVTVLGYKHITS
jgi:hypothetical protein